MAKFNSQQKPTRGEDIRLDPRKKPVVNTDYWDVDDAKNHENTVLDPENIFNDESISHQNDMSIAGVLDVKKINN